MTAKIEATALTDMLLETVTGGGRGGFNPAMLQHVMQNVPAQTVSFPGGSGTRNLNGGYLTLEMHL